MATTRLFFPRWLCWAVAVALFSGATAVVPRWWCGREGARWYGGDQDTVAALARRFGAAPKHLIETYPNEGYPVDNAAGLASLLLHQRLTGADHSAALAGTLECFRTTWRDPHTGLLLQAIDHRTGQSYDRGRASGTALASYFLAMAAPDLARPLFESICTHLAGSILGFGYVDEYTAGERGDGDIDSGPLIFGMSPSGTGFTIASARVFRDRALYVRLARTAYLTGAPVKRGADRFFITGGPLGNAILLAMFTAQPVWP